MKRFGIILVVLGFGSLVLAQFGLEFRLLTLVEPLQPGFGIVAGLVGVAVLALAVVRERRATPAADAEPEAAQ